jgi:hypothetical protein
MAIVERGTETVLVCPSCGAEQPAPPPSGGPPQQEIDN